MRIAIDARLAAYTRGGIVQYTLQLLRAMVRLGEAHRFTVLQSRRDCIPLVQAPGLATRACWTPPHHRLEQWLWPLELAPLGIDLLHCPDFVPPFRRRCPAVITVHDLGFLRFPETLTPESRRYYGQIHRAVRSAERIIAVSRSTRDDLVELVGADPARIEVVYEAANPDLVPVSDPEALAATRARFALPARFLLFVGTIEPRKNLVTLLRALAQLPERERPPLAIVGTVGWLADSFEQERKRLGLEAWVRLLGPQPNSALAPLYSAATALVYPSLYEGFGLPPLEAMACGAPVVAAATSAIPEVVGDAALLVPPTDDAALAEALRRVLADEGLRAELRARGLARARLFSWERAARDTLAVYQRAVGA